MPTGRTGPSSTTRKHRSWSWWAVPASNRTSPCDPSSAGSVPVARTRRPRSRLWPALPSLMHPARQPRPASCATSSAPRSVRRDGAKRSRRACGSRSSFWLRRTRGLSATFWPSRQGTRRGRPDPAPASRRSRPVSRDRPEPRAGSDQIAPEEDARRHHPLRALLKVQG